MSEAYANRHHEAYDTEKRCFVPANAEKENGKLKMDTTAPSRPSFCKKQIPRFARDNTLDIFQQVVRT